MAMFVHLAPEKRSKAILRSGLRLPPARRGWIRGVYAMPVTRNYFVSHQWLRELKRRGDRAFVAVHFRVPDDQVVHVGHYGQAHATVSAAEAVAVVLRAGNAEGYEVVIPRAIRPAEIHALRAVRQVLGWRYYPGSHGKRPCGCPACLSRGEIKSRKLRERYEKPPSAKTD
ncbi:MAG TPA: hypothetical protein VF950_07755 [Planctomycetota bacterium]